jgi:hypothetical protein
LSSASSLGLGCLRFKTASCWRSARFSNIRLRCARKNANHGSEPEPKQVKHGSKGIADWLARLLREVVDFKAGQDCDQGQTIAEQTESSYSRSRHLTECPPKACPIVALAGSTSRRDRRGQHSVPLKLKRPLRLRHWDRVGDSNLSWRPSTSR